MSINKEFELNALHTVGKVVAFTFKEVRSRFLDTKSKALDISKTSFTSK